ncbi:C6 finger domain protein [Akanthomyces lecanii RCEF 1005]|uniref:C6 finger domain protein n=1 Tax=Akanthomyces lecanii RCEF 1005 TaxID=1081108 RepID=A0A168AV40_CORDF|nr:C6 finger domain protein [Akanthomyces lecanii RCEF 1005]
MNGHGRLPLDHHEQLSNSVVTFFDGRSLDLRAPRETDLKTVVRKLREDSDLFSQTLDALPSPNRADASQPRKKRWTARVKTGCVTCRSRRIKCDEAKPACKRCSLTGRTCAYEAASSSPETTSSSGSSSSPEPPPPPAKGLPSPDWHVTESLQYYITVMLPMHGFHATGDSAYVSSYQAKKMMRDEGFDSASFVMQILSHRVQCMSSAHQVQNVYGALPAVKPVWERLFHQMALAVSNLNRFMALEKNVYFVLHRVVDLMHTELTLSIPTWRAHAEGFGALVKTYGGIPTLFRLPKPPAMSSQLALIASAMCNSTSPADQQIKLMSNWSDEDIDTAYSHTGFHAFPCPTVLFQAISRITHLRTLVAGCTDAAVVDRLVPLAREAFAKIQHFDPAGWTEPYPTDHEFYPVVGRAFQYAVALYGILSLPAPLAAVFTYPPEAGTPQAHEAHRGDENHELIYTTTQLYSTTRIRYREHLFTLFQRALPAAPSIEGLLWHAAVLGVAYSNHEEEEQKIILDYVASLRFVYGADGGAIHLYDKLREFWASGKKEWDQCFYEPTNILT